jgi:hypothetical protein
MRATTLPPGSCSIFDLLRPAVFVVPINCYPILLLNGTYTMWTLPWRGRRHQHVEIIIFRMAD